MRRSKVPRALLDIAESVSPHRTRQVSLPVPNILLATEINRLLTASSVPVGLSAGLRTAQVPAQGQAAGHAAGHAVMASALRREAAALADGRRLMRELEAAHALASEREADNQRLKLIVKLRDGQVARLEVDA